MKYSSFEEFKEMVVPKTLSILITGYFNELEKVSSDRVNYLTNRILNNEVNYEEDESMNLDQGTKYEVDDCIESNLQYKELRNSGPIGLNQLLKQKCKITARKGINYNIMVAGQVGVGKTTLINSLFGTTILDKIDTGNNGGLEINKFILENNEMRLNFNCIESVNYGNQANNSFNWIPLTNYIDEQMKTYIFQEEQPIRTQLIDSRVHLCLYLFEPTNCSKNVIKLLDILTMKEISKNCNLIPVIVKCDILTKKELQYYKEKVKELFEIQKIEVCKFLRQTYNKELIKDWPFGIITSQERIINEKGEYKLGRKYKWGTIDIENPKSSDFNQLKNIIINKNLVDFIESTESAYENIRNEMLQTRLSKSQELIENKNPPKGLITKINDEIRNKLIGREINFNNINCNGLKLNYCYEIFNKKLMDQILIEWSPEYIEHQLEFKKKFNSILRIEDNKFQEWKKALIEKQTKFNKTIEVLYREIDILKLQCQELEYQIVTGRQSCGNNIMPVHNDHSTTLVTLHHPKK